MRTPNKEKVKEVLLQLLDEFISVCKKYNLRYCAAYGTLLGAIREGSIIDGDYDADVFMPYEDYHKLYELNKTKGIFRSPFYLDTYDINNPFSLNYQLKKSGTTAIKDVAYPGSNIFMDIYPIFKVPNDNKTKDLLILLGRMFVDSRYLYRCSNHFLNGRQQIIDLDRCIAHLNTEDISDDKKISIEYHDFLHWKYTSNKLTEKRFLNCSSSVIDFNNLKNYNLSMLRNGSVAVPSNFEELLQRDYGNWHIPVASNDPETDWFLDSEHDWTFYAPKFSKETK